jgi:arabinogalactan oligomer / maltooligosaccharide transport system permease protein
MSTPRQPTTQATMTQTQVLTTRTGGRPVRRTPTRRSRWWAEVGWKYPVAVVIVFYAVFPLIYVLSAAFKPGGSLAGST